MDNIARNIKFLRKKNGLTQDDLARKIGVSRYKIGSYEEGRAMPRLDLLRVMAAYFNLSIDVFVNTPLYDNAAPKTEAFGHDSQGLRVLTTVVNENNEERFAIVPDKASAGYTSGYADPDFIEKLPVFDLPLPEFRNDRTYRVFQISGDSMEPIASGSYIICEYITNVGEIHYGAPHIIVTHNDGIVYKRIEKENGNDKVWKLVSDNPEYKAYTIALANVLEVWKAVGFISTQLPDAHDISRNKIRYLIDALRNELSQFGNE